MMDFQAGNQFHAVFSCYAHKFFYQEELVFMAYTAGHRKIPESFPVEVDKAENAGIGISFQYFCQSRECADMIIDVVISPKKDRVIAPAQMGRSKAV